MGHNQTRALQQEPEIRELYEQYLLCRSTEIKVVRKPTGKPDGSEKLVVFVWTTGIPVWPRAGGLDNQSYYTTKIFAAFLRGDQMGAQRLLAK